MVKKSETFVQHSMEQNGTTYSYSVGGKESGQLVVILHGVSGRKEDMVQTGIPLIRKGYKVYLLDLPNHGGSSPLALERFGQLGEWLHDALQAMNIEPHVLIGNSYGSGICYSYAAQGFLPPHTQLILGCPTPTIAQLSRMLGSILLLLPRPLVRPFYNSRMMIAIRVSYLSRIKGTPRQLLRDSEINKIPYLDVVAATQMGRLIGVDSPFTEQLSESIQRRTTVLIGDRDNVVTSRSVAILRQLLSYADFDIIHGAGHILHFEAPERIVARVKGVA